MRHSAPGLTNVYLSLVGPCTSVQVKEAVTVGTQVATYVTQNDGRRLTVVVIIAHGLERTTANKAG